MGQGGLLRPLDSGFTGDPASLARNNMYLLWVKISFYGLISSGTVHMTWKIREPYYLQEQAADCNDPEIVSETEPAANDARPNMEQILAQPEVEGQGFSRVDAMRNLESYVNEELDARQSRNR